MILFCRRLVPTIWDSLRTCHKFIKFSVGKSLKSNMLVWYVQFFHHILPDTLSL